MPDIADGVPRDDELQHREVQLRPWTMRALEQLFRAKERYARAKSCRSVAAWVGAIALLVTCIRLVGGFPGLQWPLVTTGVCAVLLLWNWVTMLESKWAECGALLVLGGMDPGDVHFPNYYSRWGGLATYQPSRSELFQRDGKCDTLDSDGCTIREILNPSWLRQAARMEQRTD